MGLDEVQGRDEVLFKVEGVLRRIIMCMVGKIQHGCFLEWYKWGVL